MVRVTKAYRSARRFFNFARRPMRGVRQPIFEMRRIVKYTLLGLSLLPLFAAEEISRQPASEVDSMELSLPRNALSNEGVALLAKAGFDEDFLITLIQHKQTHFDTTVEGLMFLAKHGVSERVIRCMLENENKAASPTPTSLPAKEAEPASPPLAVRVRSIWRRVLVPNTKAKQEPILMMDPQAAGQLSAPSQVILDRHLLRNRWYVVTNLPGQ
jgi:hypothetical protein